VVTVRCEQCGADHEHERTDNLVGAFCLGALAVLVVLGWCGIAGWLS
jgi:uncharacterized protein (DUF983 family)